MIKNILLILWLFLILFSIERWILKNHSIENFFHNFSKQTVIFNCEENFLTYSIKNKKGLVSFSTNNGQIKLAPCSKSI